MMCARPSWPYDRYGDKEYVDHVLRYYQITASGGSYPANGMQIPHYLQTDYGNIPYGGGSIASSGCGPTSFAMIASYLTGTTITLLMQYPGAEIPITNQESALTGLIFRQRPIILGVGLSHRPVIPTRYFRLYLKVIRSSVPKEPGFYQWRTFYCPSWCNSWR